MFYGGLIEDNLRGDGAAARSAFAAALTAAEEAGEELTISEALRHLGYHASEAGDADQARQMWERSTQQRQRAGAVPYVLSQQLLLAGLAPDGGDPDTARCVARRSAAGRTLSASACWNPRRRCWLRGLLRGLAKGQLRREAGQVQKVVQDAVEGTHGHRQVTVTWHQVDAGVPDVRGQPLAVRERDHPVLVALPDGRPARASAGAGPGESQPREKPQSRTNAKSSSRQPAMPEFIAVRRQAATWPANSPVSTGLSASITRPPSEEATLSAVIAPIMAGLPAEKLGQRGLAAHRGAELGDVLRRHAASQSSPSAV